MYFKSKNTSLLILGITAILSSRAMFALFNDPEGPNLLIVLCMAAIVYLVSLAVYFFFPSTKLTGLNRLLAMILVQILVVTGCYLFLR